MLLFLATVTCEITNLQVDITKQTLALKKTVTFTCVVEKSDSSVDANVQLGKHTTANIVR